MAQCFKVFTAPPEALSSVASSQVRKFTAAWTLAPGGSDSLPWPPHMHTPTPTYAHTIKNNIFSKF